MREQLKLLVAELLLIVAAGLMGLAHWLLDEDNDTRDELWNKAEDLRIESMIAASRYDQWRCRCPDCSADVYGQIICAECGEVQ